MSLTFSLCTPLPGSFVLLQTYGHFASLVLKLKPFDSAFSLTVLQSNGILSLSDIRRIQSSDAFWVFFFFFFFFFSFSFLIHHRFHKLVAIFTATAANTKLDTTKNFVCCTGKAKVRISQASDWALRDQSGSRSRKMRIVLLTLLSLINTITLKIIEASERSCLCV